MKHKKSTALAIDTNGARWKWNCGWYVVNEHGEPLRTRAKEWKRFGLYKIHPNPSIMLCQTSVQRADLRQQPLTHAQFRKAVKLLDPREPKQREVLHSMDRPGRHWRRMTSREVYSHDLFGNVYLLASDGCHAIVETVDGDHEKVCFENLTELAGVPMHPRTKKQSPDKEKKQTNRESNLRALISKYTPKPTN